MGKQLVWMNYFLSPHPAKQKQFIYLAARLLHRLVSSDREGVNKKLLRPPWTPPQLLLRTFNVKVVFCFVFSYTLDVLRRCKTNFSTKFADSGLLPPFGEMSAIFVLRPPLF